ncbi:MAG: PorP/SprF family type IX secretion system membrane protein [Bacteroidetes bacterium]|nr:PorP/SprF family type IX secretion system membrane protein [Bacteroidota bacterium]MBS1930639.1 PorP/SprF family type IX secretion system membrane protein [Bacteroidota bacterium]
MKKLKIILVAFSLISGPGKAKAQDPSFSQFFSSPLNVNPALTAQINSKWRAISNYRSQWIGPNKPFNTGTLSFDSKIFQNLSENYVDEITRVGIGGMMLYDQSLGGAVKSSFASLNISGNIRLKEGVSPDWDGRRIRHISKIRMDAGAEQRLGAGIGISYGNRRIDFSKLTFENQFNGIGFDASLPSGESGLSNMKPIISANAGLLYSYINDGVNFDFGVAVYHFNKPKQTVLDNDKEFLAPRYVIHSNYERVLTDQVVLNTNGIYQYQSGASYFSLGGALGYYLSNDENFPQVVNAGLWYWSKNAIIPYIGYSYGNFQLGITYDITISKLKEGPQRMQTFELCLVIRGGSSDQSGIIPAPWK